MKLSFVSGIGTLVLSGLVITGCQSSESADNAPAAAEEENEQTTAENAENQSNQPEEENVHTHENEHANEEDNNHNHAHNDNHSHNHDHNEEEHEHNHVHDEESQEIYDGYFEDDQIEDRPLSDWEGDWQSVYPFLQDGTLDEVFAHKAEESEDMTAEDYKEYYETGYETDTDRIVIDGDTVTFYEDGAEFSGEYLYDGYEILTYEAGNRGVRFIFALDEESEELPQYIQFSDHIISPEKSDHFHLYWGDDRELLLDEVTHWPTYYPSEMNGDEIVHEMISH
ncbi:metal-binding protein ZinT [Alkalicoccus daliensis]|uniref:Zinc transport system substrate-binding protein n=1 Tax=Alkalicoccus daliensis TaxID=745820 RepID=A0A1H0EQA0_9BACI|nr:metal-binding protein ZinT [Alkalicoccus daliensis]SDN84540.1 zinc transport system substrate-binding protein [Alkalicoccus daliensis]